MSSLPPPENRPTVGTVLEGRYKIIGELGEGGIGWVYRAEHLRLGHHVAVKMLQTQFVGHDQMRPRFEREAKALAALSHPNIVMLTDYSVADGRPFLVMEVLEGETLADRIDRGPMSEAEAKPIVRQVLEALAFAHQRGFVHRDLKPDNIFLVREPPDFVKVLDFGLVKLVDPTSEADSMSAKLTRSGAVFGTPAYMSPEQISADRIDATTDVYALGITIYEMLKGTRPFDGENSDVLRAHLTTEIPRLVTSESEASPELVAFLAKATAKKRANRFVSAEEMLAAFEALPSPWLVPRGSGAMALPVAPPKPSVAAPVPMPAAPPPRSPSVGFVFGILGVVAIAAAGLAVVVRNQSGESSTNAETAPPAPAPRAEVREPERGRASDVEAVAERVEVATRVASRFGESPWTTYPPVPLLDEARRRVVDGTTLDETTERALKDYARANHGDPRPHLVLGEHYFLKRFRSDAIERLNLGQRLGPTARNDPRMLAIVLVLFVDSDSSSAAGTLIATHYGRAALPALRAELERGGLGQPARNRVEALIRRVR